MPGKAACSQQAPGPAGPRKHRVALRYTEAVLLDLFWIFSAAAIFLGALSLRAGQRRLHASLAGMKDRPEECTPPATLIVPLKGREEGLRENLRSLVEQDYPDFELLMAVRSETDPAVEEVRPLLSSRVRLVVAGAGPPDTGEKVANLLAAVAEARPSSQVLAFADSDGRVERDWLRALVSPLRDPRVGAVTGYRWYFPERAGFWPLLRSVWNSTIAGSFGAGPAAFAWGGAMALRRETFRDARVAEFWIGAVSDDYRLSQAIRTAGLEIRYTPRAMVATAGGCSAGEFLSWAVRQLTITRIYSPRLWWPGLAAHVVYCCAMLAGAVVIAGGGLWAIPIWLLAIAPGMLRGAMRLRAASAMFPARKAWFDRHGWAYGWLAPLVTWIWLYVFLASLFRRRIEWRGHVYELQSATETRVLR